MSLVMPATNEAATEIAGFESLRLSVYLDARGVPTIGFGTTHYLDGTAVRLGDPEITRDQAMTLLIHYVDECAFSLWHVVQRQPSTNQWAAMLSLAYNEGWPVISTSTLLRLFNQGNIAGAANEFPKWDKLHHDGELVVCDGLLERRMKERVLFLTPDGQPA